MKCNFWTCLMAMLALTLVAPALTGAQETIPVVSSFDDAAVVATEDESWQDVCQCCESGWLCGGGWEGGIDLLLFNVHTNHGVSGTGADWFEDFDTSVDARVYAGFRTADGMGLQLRYFEFEGDPTAANERLDVTMIDLEASSVLDICDWQLTGIAGLRYGLIEWSDEDGAPGFEFEGVGMLLGGEVRRCLGPNLTAFAGARYSALYGETETAANPAIYANGIAVHGLETNLGVEWCRCTRAGMMTLGFGWEQQLYTSLSGNVTSQIDPEDVDITLSGPMFRLGLQR